MWCYADGVDIGMANATGIFGYVINGGRTSSTIEGVTLVTQSQEILA